MGGRSLISSGIACWERNLLPSPKAPESPFWVDKNRRSWLSSVGGRTCPQLKVRLIDAPPSKVWDFVSDIEKAPEWVTVMKGLVSTTANPLTAGAVYRELSKVGPKESETEWRVTLFDPPQRQVHECSESTLKAQLTLVFEPQEGQTRLVHQTEYQLMPVFRPLGWVLEKLFAHAMMTRNMEQTVDNAKRMIEAAS